MSESQTKGIRTLELKRCECGDRWLVHAGRCWAVTRPGTGCAGAKETVPVTELAPVLEALEEIERHHAMPGGESWEDAYNEVCEIARALLEALSPSKEER